MKNQDCNDCTHREVCKLKEEYDVYIQSIKSEIKKDIPNTSCFANETVVECKYFQLDLSPRF